MKFFSYQPPVSPLLPTTSTKRRVERCTNSNFDALQTGGKPVGWTPVEFIPKEPTLPPAEAEVNAPSSEPMPNDQLLSPPNSQADVDDATSETMPHPSQEKGQDQDHTQQNDRHPTQQHDDTQVITPIDTPMIDVKESWCMVKGAEATLSPTFTETSAANTGDTDTVTVSGSGSAFPAVDGEETWVLV